MARGSAHNVVESKTRQKKVIPVKEKDSKKTNTATGKAANMRKVEKTAPAKKGATKASSTAIEDIEENKETGNAAIKKGNKKTQKEVNKNVKKAEIPTKTEKFSRKRKIDEADEPVHDKPNENKSGETAQKRTKTNLSSNASEDLPSKVSKKSEKVPDVKTPVRKARNLKKGKDEKEQTEEDMSLQKETEVKSKKSKADLTQETNPKKSSAAAKGLTKAVEKESNAKFEKAKKALPVSQRMKNAKKNIDDANSKNVEDKTDKEESNDESESEISESCEVEVSAKDTRKKIESKAATKGKKNTNVESNLRKTRNAKKSQEQDLSKSSEVENKMQEEEDNKIIAKADESKNKKVENRGRKARNTKITETNTDVETGKLDHDSEQLETGKEKDQGKTRNYKRGSNNKSDTASKTSENPVNENQASAGESQPELENESNEAAEKKANKKRIFKKTDESDVTAATRKTKRGVKLVTEEESTLKVLPSVEEENSSSNSMDTLKAAPARKTRKGGKTIPDEEATEHMLISAEIEELDEENSNSNSTDNAKTAPTRKTRRGKTILDEETTGQIQISSDIKDLDDDTSNSNLSNSADTAKTAPTRKRRGKKTDSVEVTEQMQFSTDLKDLDGENNNSNLSKSTDVTKAMPARNTRRGQKTVPDEEATEHMQISADIKDLDEDNSNSNLSNSTDTAKAVPIKKTRRGIKIIPDEKSAVQMQISVEIKDLDEENSNLSNISDSAKALPTRKTRRGIKAVSDKESSDQMEFSAEVNLVEENNDSSDVADCTTAVSARKLRRGVKAGEESNEGKQISNATKNTNKDNSNSNDVLNTDKTSFEITISGKTSKESVSKNKCNKLSVAKKSISQLQSDMEETIEKVDENSEHRDTADIPCVVEVNQTKSENVGQIKNISASDDESMPKLQISDGTYMYEDNSNSNDFPNLAISASAEKMKEMKTADKDSKSSNLKDDIQLSNDKEMVEIDQSSVDELENEESTESDPRENKDMKVSTEISGVIKKDIGNPCVDEQNELSEVEVGDSKKNEHLEEITEEGISDKETKIRSDDIHGTDCDNLISDIELDQTEILELPEDEELNSKEIANVKTIEINKFSKENENDENKYSPEVFKEKGPEKHLKSNQKLSNDDINVSAAGKSNYNVSSGIEKDTSEVKCETDLSVKDTEFENDQNINLDEEMFDVTNSKDSFLDENASSDKENLLDENFKHSSKSVASSAECLKETSGVIEKDIFDTSAGSSSQLRINAGTKELEETLVDHQLIDSNNEMKEQEALNIDEQLEEISVESNNHLRENEACVEDSELLKEIPLNNISFEKKSVIPVCEQTSDDERHEKTSTSHQSDGIFLNNNEKPLPGDKYQIDEMAAIISNHQGKASVDNTKKVNVLSPVNDGHEDKTSELYNEVSDEFEHHNTQPDDNEEFSQSHDDNICSDVAPQLDKIIVNKGGQFNETFVDNNQCSKNILIEKDCRGTVDDAKLIETSVENGLSKGTVVETVEQLNKKLTDNEVMVNSREITNEFLVTNDCELSDCEEQLDGTSPDNRKLNESSVANDGQLSDCEEQFETSHDSSKLKESSVANDGQLSDCEEELNETSLDNSNLNESSVASNSQLLDYEEKQETSSENRKLNVQSVANEGQLSDCEEQLNETSTDNKKLNESSFENDSHLSDCEEELNDTADNLKDLVNICLSADGDHQLNESAIGDDEQLNLAPVDNKELIEISAICKEQPNESLVAENDQKDLPLFDSRHLDVSSVGEVKVSDDKKVDETLDNDMDLLNGLLTEDSMQLKDSSPSDCAHLKVSNPSDVAELKESSIGEDVQLEVIPISDAMQTKESPASDDMQLKESPAGDDMQLKESPASDDMQLKESPNSDVTHLKETSSNAMQLTESSTSDAIHLKESSTSDAIQLKESSNSEVSHLEETSSDSTPLQESLTCNVVHLENLPAGNCVQFKEPATKDTMYLENSSDSDNEQLNNTSVQNNLLLNETSYDKSILLNETSDFCSELAVTTFDCGQLKKPSKESNNKMLETSNVNIEHINEINSGKFQCTKADQCDEGEGNNVNEENAADKNGMPVMSPKNLNISEKLNLEDENKLVTSENDGERENYEVPIKQDAVKTLKTSEESSSCELDTMKEEARKEAISAEKNMDLKEKPDSCNNPSVNKSKIVHNRESDSSTYTKRVDSGTFSIVKKDGNRKKTKLIKTTGSSKQLSDEELMRLSANVEQSKTSDFESGKKAEKRKSENPGSTSIKKGIDCSTEISVAIKIKKKKVEEEESMSDVEEKMVRSLLGADTQSSGDSQCPSEPGPSRVETEAELNSKKRKAATSSSSPTSSEAKKSKIKGSSIPVRMYLEQFVPFLLEGLLKITYVRPEDPIQYLADWMKDNKVAAYRRMNS